MGLASERRQPRNLLGARIVAIVLYRFYNTQVLLTATCLQHGQLCRRVVYGPAPFSALKRHHATEGGGWPGFEGDNRLPKTQH